MNLLIICAAATIFFVLQAVYWSLASRRSARQDVLAQRLGTSESATANDSLLRGAEGGTWVDQLSFAAAIRGLLEEAGEEGAIGPFATRCIVFFLGTFTLMLIITADPFGAFFFGLMAVMIPYLMLVRKRRLRVSRIEEQLPEALEVMTISLRAGQSLAQTIRLTAQEIQPPIGDELRRVSEESELGRPLDEALIAMSQRLKQARTVRTFVVSVLVLRQTGGNLIEVLESIIDTMRQQSQYERKLKAMTAEGRSSSRMLAFLPPGFMFMAYLANPGYIGNLLSDPVGRMLMAISLILYVVGLFWVRRLVNPKV